MYGVDTGMQSGEENMETDRKLMAAFLDGRFQNKFGAGSCLWRFYAWYPFAVTLGYNQDIGGIDIEKCRQAGIDVVRRPTGGRAVFHADEFTYSFFTESPAGNAEIYRMVHEVIMLALQGLGIKASFCRSTLPQAKSGGPPPVSCFTASARYELQVEGRKLVGSAQRRSRSVLLQHGSLPLSVRHRELSRLIACPGSEDFEAVRDEMERKTVSLEEILGHVPSYGTLVGLMQRAAGEYSGKGLMLLEPADIAGIIENNV